MSNKLTRRFAVAAVASMSLFGLAACELPSPPVDGVEQAAKDEKQKQDAAAQQASQAELEQQRQRAAQEAQAGQSGMVEGGPSVVSAAQRLEFIKSEDITMVYKTLGFTVINDQTSELTVPANSRVIREGERLKLEDVPKLYMNSQMLPKADLNGVEIVILNIEMRSDNLVFTLLGNKISEESQKTEGTLTLKAPDTLKDMCEEAPGADCSNRDLFGRDWTDQVYNNIIVRKANMTNLTAAGASLTNADFSGAQLFRANFSGANVSGANFRGIKGQNLMMNSNTATADALTTAENTDFTGSYLYRCEFDKSKLGGSVWDDVDAQNCTFDGANMKNFRASNAWLHRMKASNVVMTDAIAPNVRMSQGTLSRSNLRGSNLSGGRLDRVEGSDANFGEVVLTGKGCTMSQSYLDRANLVDMQASGCSFTRASMKNVDGRNFIGTNADMTYTDLKGADFSKANFAGANFFNADTKGVKMAGATLTGATCPNGDIVGKTNYSKWFRTNKYGGANRSFTVTGCNWDDKGYSIAGDRVFESKTVDTNKVKVDEDFGMIKR